MRRRLRAAWNCLLGRPTMYRVVITDQGQLDPDTDHGFFAEIYVPFSFFPEDIAERLREEVGADTDSGTAVDPG